MIYYLAHALMIVVCFGAGWLAHDGWMEVKAGKL